MLELQENIARVQSATAGLRRKLVDRATEGYFHTLDLVTGPTVSDFEAAQARANATLRQELLAGDAMTLMNGGTKLDDDGLALVALGFDAIARPLRTPGPATMIGTKPVTLAMAGAIGAVVGILVLTPLTRLAFEMRDLGLIFGGPLGALLAVLVACQLARIRFLTRILPWVFTRPKALRGAVRSEHEKAVRAAVEQWVEWAVSMLAVLCLQGSGRKEAQTDKDKALRRLGKLVYALHQAPAESLPVVAHELIQEAKNSGFEGLEGQPAFLDADHVQEETITWRQDLRSKYEAFGAIAEGDRVKIERPAVVFGGKVVQRGLVRRIRDKQHE